MTPTKPSNNAQDRSNSFTGLSPRDAEASKAFIRSEEGGLNVALGRVVEAVPFTRQYTVRVAGMPHLTCGHGIPGHVLCLPVGTPVIVAIYPGSNRGTVLAVEPTIDGGGPTSPLHGSVILGGGAYGISSPMFDAYKNTPAFGGLEPRADYVPTDSLPGDDGVLSRMDVGMIVSFGMAMMRATDTAAVEVYAFDNLLRLHGHNYERFAAGYERRQFDDEGEVHDVEFGAKFPWEGDGVTGQNPIAFYKDDSVAWGDTSAYVEPAFPDQTGAWRIQTLRGYLGDMFRQQVLRQPDSRKSDPARYVKSERGGPVALSDAHYGANGSIHFRSAKEILLQKYVLLPAAEQTALPDDMTNGDSNVDYKASGLLGDGDDPVELKEYDWGADVAANKKAAVLNEYLAYVTNFFGPANIVEHRKDWSYPDEGADSPGWDVTRAAIDAGALAELRDRYWAGLPKMRTIEIDSRLPKVNYYESSAAVMIMDDGSIVLEDAWGSSIQMGRGNIVFNCPGDILANPGRRCVTQAGLDYIVRARNSVDVTTTEGDIRLRADRNLHALAGNDRDDQSGGVLIESRAQRAEHDYSKQGEGTVSSGITLMARDSQVAAVGRDVYIGASGTDGGSADEPAIVIDASRTQRSIYAVARQVLRRATQFVDRYGDREVYASATADLWFTQAANLVVGGNILAAKTKGRGGNMLAQESLVVSGSAMVEKSIVAGSTIATSAQVFAARGVGKEGKSSMVGGTDEDQDLKGLVERTIAKVDRKFEQALNDINRVARDAQAKEKRTDAAVRDDGHFGGEQLIGQVKVSLRTDEDYAAGDFSMFEPSWQSHENLPLDVWEEKPVKGGSAETWPFPGGSGYNTPGSLLVAARRLFKTAEGKATARGDVYTEKPEEDEKKTLNEYRTLKVEKQ